MYEQYCKLTDEEIVAKIREDDPSAMDYLLEKYKNMIRKKARTLFLIGADKDDLIQEGMIGLYKAIRDYRRDRESSFFTFADLCISRQMYTAVKASNRKKNIPLNSYVSIYAPLYGENIEEEDKTALVDIMYQKNISNPEELFIDKENRSVIEYELGRRLSLMEKEVLAFYLSGLTYLQIAERMEKEAKSIDNALQRIKTKLNQVMEEMK